MCHSHLVLSDCALHHGLHPACGRTDPCCGHTCEVDAACGAVWSAAADTHLGFLSAVKWGALSLEGSHQLLQLLTPYLLAALHSGFCFSAEMWELWRSF